MGALTGQTIAASYEQLLHVDTDGGGATTTLVPVKDGDNGTTFCLQLATTSALISGSGSKLLFSDNGGEYISGDGTDLTITSGTDILLAAGGNIGIGITTMSAPAGADPKVQIEGTDADNSSLSVWRNTAGASGPYFTIGHSRGAGLNSVNALVDNDIIGTIQWSGGDGSDRSPVGANIFARIDGDPASNDMPTELVFGTTADGGSAAPTERMIIDKAGNVGIGTSSPASALGVTQVLTIGDGSLGTVGIVLKDNNNTWEIYNNDSLIFNDGSDERMRIDASGNVGVGVTPTQLFHVEGASANDWVSRIKTTTTTAGQSYGLQLIAGTNASDVSFAVKNQANNATYLEVQGDGLVGIGTASPGSPLSILKSNLTNVSSDILRIENSGTGSTLSGTGAGLTFVVGDTNAGPSNVGFIWGQQTGEAGTWDAAASLNFRAGNTTPTVSNAAMSILPSGYVGIGETGPSSKLHIKGASITNVGILLLQVTDTSAADHEIQSFYDGDGTHCGEITIHATNHTTAYVTSSDYRLKENDSPISDGLTRLNQLKPKRFNFKSNPNKTKLDGFFAHEVSSIVPEAIMGDKDGMKINPDTGEEEMKFQGIDHSKLVPLLVSAVQELSAKVEALEST